MRQFSYDGLGATPITKSEVPNGMAVATTKFRFHKLLEALFLAGDTVRFGEAVEKYVEVFPPQSSFEPGTVLAIDAYYAAKFGQMAPSAAMFQGAEGIAEAVLNRLAKKEKIERRDLVVGLLNASALATAYEKLDRKRESESWDNKYQLLMKEFGKP
jgi:hypothetical protein